jgi:hypothetical protein
MKAISWFFKGQSKKVKIPGSGFRRSEVQGLVFSGPPFLLSRSKLRYGLIGG